LEQFQTAHVLLKPQTIRALSSNISAATAAESAGWNASHLTQQFGLLLQVHFLLKCNPVVHAALLLQANNSCQLLQQAALLVNWPVALLMFALR
jgi:hypothetical protein